MARAVAGCAFTVRDEQFVAAGGGPGYVDSEAVCRPGLGVWRSSMFPVPLSSSQHEVAFPKQTDLATSLRGVHGRAEVVPDLVGSAHAPPWTRPTPNEAR